MRSEHLDALGKMRQLRPYDEQLAISREYLEEHRHEMTMAERVAIQQSITMRERWASEAAEQREALRRRESAILRAVEILDPADDSLEARHLRECAEQIRDHRAAGNYTTNHR